MKFLQLSLFMLFVLCFSNSKSIASNVLFFESLYDIPIMSGLTEVKEMGLSFDKAEGRIAYATAFSQVHMVDILAFYDETLPQMGWKKTASGIFTREQEELRISFEKTKTSLLVRFSLGPVSG